MTEIELAAGTLEVHQIEWVSHRDGYVCGCDDRGVLPQMLTLSDALKHQAAEVLKVAGVGAERERIERGLAPVAERYRNAGVFARAVIGDVRKVIRASDAEA